jgi:large subunit ribosomal protein L3
VFKGKKMAGHMGDRQRTQMNLEVVRTDADRGLLFIKGSVPGSKNGWLLVRDAIKLPLSDDLPFPGAVRETAKPSNDEIAADASEQDVATAVPSQGDEAVSGDSAPATDTPQSDIGPGEEKKED